jgi:hypothetical protein
VEKLAGVDRLFGVYEEEGSLAPDAPKVGGGDSATSGQRAQVTTL